MLLADWIERWSDTALEASDRKPATKQRYREIARKHLCRILGDVSLSKLRKSHVDALVVTLRREGLADTSVRLAYTVLRAVLADAESDKLIADNAAARAGRPGIARREARHLSAADVVKVLNAAAGERYRNVLVLIATTGLRRGEALALSWDHVNLKGGALKVVATANIVDGQLDISEPKSDRSRRAIPLSPAVVTLLKAQRATQAGERLRAGERWTDRGLVFTDEFGAPVNPRAILRAVQRSAARAGVKDVTVHTLRHSAAVAWLEAGAHIKVVADLLGHSSIAITGDIYGHASDAATRSAVDGLSEVLGL
ncbi:tyrosine-type recombinase/integrase [Mycobacterium sp.]|uniref:tyrosine-type recombinase/integrase n=1 Tax=Mycobacterium sp. TaxID=1785 RepID=UPI003F9A2BFF